MNFDGVNDDSRTEEFRVFTDQKKSIIFVGISQVNQGILTMIILEGPDNSGKTTLANQLSEALELPILHSGGPCESRADADNRMNKILSGNQETIWDRVPCISEPIYGITLRDVNYFYGSGWLDRLLETRPLIIFCRPPNHIIFEKHELGEHDTPEHIDQLDKDGNKELIVKMYDESMKDMPSVYYDWTSANMQYLSLLVFTCSLHGRLSYVINELPKLGTTLGPGLVKLFGRRTPVPGSRLH